MNKVFKIWLAIIIAALLFGGTSWVLIRKVDVADRPNISNSSIYAFRT